MNTQLRWYRRTVWLGIVLNLGFAVPALVAPDMLTAALGLPYLDYYEWMENAGMLILSLNVFYAVAAQRPVEYGRVNWIVVLSRVIAAVFWVYLVNTSEYPSAFYTMLGIDASLAVVLGLLLQTGLPQDKRLSWRGVETTLLSPLGLIRQLYERKPLRYLTLAIGSLLGIGLYALYVNLLQPHPEMSYEKDEDQFKYGAIGLGMSSRIPLYIFNVLPTIFKDKLPANGEEGYRSLGFIYEPGHNLPVGLAERHIGYKSVEPNCAFCHTGTYKDKDLTNNKPKLILGGPAHELDLEAFQWFLYDCAADKRFNPDTLMRYIDQLTKMSPMEHLVYKRVIIPFAKSSLLKQGRAYAWQNERPRQGKGRTDTFNPTKDNVFHFPDDQTVGTVDLPQVWNQRPRQNLFLHWDGNNNSLNERNYAAAMAVGATPESVIPQNFERVTNFLLGLQPPKYPYAIDNQLVAEGAKLYKRECKSCHSFGEKLTGQVTELEKIGTDPNRLYSFTFQLVERFHEFRKAPFKFDSYRKTYGYSNTPLDGVWARAPYLHNGSVPSLWDLLQTPDKRPTVFYKGYNEYDPDKVGFVSSGQSAEKMGFKLETSLKGNGNQGHLYGTNLNDQQKRALLEYLKTM